MNQIIPIYLVMDPFNEDKVQKYYALNKKNQAKGVPDSTVIYWDSHFGQVEGRIALKSLKNNKDLEVIYHRDPNPPIKMGNGENLEFYLFHKN